MKTVEADLDGAQRHSQTISDCRILEILQVSKPNQLGVAGRQLRKRLGHA
jgi:hypothetical protein